MSDTTGRIGATSAQLKADIDSGRTADKIAQSDPGLSPLGTDDEAAGMTPSPERIAMARAAEAKPDAVRAQEVGRDSTKPRGLAIGLMVAVAIVVALVVAWRLFAGAPG